jgi:hypothetical protein
VIILAFGLGQSTFEITSGSQSVIDRAQDHER